MEKKIGKKKFARLLEEAVRKVSESEDAGDEDAPEAGRVADWLRRSFRKQDYIDIREIAAWLVFRNPLCYMPEFLDSIDEETGQRCKGNSITPQEASVLRYGIGILAADNEPDGLSVDDSGGCFGCRVGL